jgi:hypothetical protein
MASEGSQSSKSPKGAAIENPRVFAAYYGIEVDL